MWRKIRTNRPCRKPTGPSSSAVDELASSQEADEEAERLADHGQPLDTSI